MGKFGWHSGAVKAQNLQGGTSNITVDASGDGTASVTFDSAMKESPAIIMTARESDTTGTLSVTSPASTGFIAKVDGSSVTGDTLTISWVAFNDRLK